MSISVTTNNKTVAVTSNDTTVTLTTPVSKSVSVERLGSQGISGFSGYSGLGLSGYSGISGYSGPVGTAGAAGVSGYSGYSGVNGVIGVDGVSGYSGYSGRNGIYEAVLSDVVNSTSYIGVAAPGSATSSSVWRITRNIFNSAGNVTSTMTATNVKWDDRLTATYT